jgi:hypothetical protein
MQFFKELAAKIQSFKYKRPLFKCKAFEDNNGAIAIATTENLRPRTNTSTSNIITSNALIGWGRTKYAIRPPQEGV